MAKDPKQLNKKLERFLQFHDQRTAGIPGLCPLFVGLRMRVTEKVMKTSQITILKHTPCYVVSWDLHLAIVCGVMRANVSFLTSRV